MGLFDLFSGVGSALKTAETGAKIVEKATTGIMSAGDMMFYTDEEKAIAGQKKTDTILGFWKTYATENTEQSKARREIAKMFVLMFAGVLGLGVGLILIGETEKLNQLILFLKILGFAWIIGSIVATYFVPHQFSKLGIFSGNKDK